MKFKVPLELTPEEAKVLAYTCGYALFVIENPRARQQGLTNLDREAAADVLQTKMQKLLSTLMSASSSAQEVQLDDDVAYCLASSIGVALDNFKVDFLDWRVDRCDDAEVAITSFAPLSSVWLACFTDLLQQPDSADLNRWEESWQRVQLKLHRALGLQDPTALRRALQSEYETRAAKQPYRDELLRIRRTQILRQRQEQLELSLERLGEDAEDSCPTCSASLTGEPFCKACAEALFPLQMLDTENPAFRDNLRAVFSGLDEMNAFHRASYAWALLNDLLHSSEACSCQKCSCGTPYEGDGLCSSCGFVHWTLEEVGSPVDWTLMLQFGRRHRMAYNLADGRPVFKTFGAFDLTVQTQLEEALNRQMTEALDNSQKVRAYIDQVGEISDIAGLKR